MSQENVELTRRAYEAFNRDELEELAIDVAPEFEYVATGAIPDTPAVFRGPDAYKEFSAWMREEFSDVRADVHELTDAGDRVLAEIMLRGRGRLSGLETSWHIWHVWTMRDGKLVRGRAFSSREEALREAGLQS